MISAAVTSNAPASIASFDQNFQVLILLLRPPKGKNEAVRVTQNESGEANHLKNQKTFHQTTFMHNNRATSPSILRTTRKTFLYYYYIFDSKNWRIGKLSDDAI